MTPVDERPNLEVVSFRAQFDQKSPLDELVREGALRTLQAAIDAEVIDLRNPCSVTQQARQLQCIQRNHLLILWAAEREQDQTGQGDEVVLYQHGC